MTQTTFVKNNDGEIVGSVIRDEKSVTISQQIMGTKSVYWDAVDLDGNSLGNPFTRKRDAIARVIRSAEPLTFTDIEFKEDAWTNRPYISATVKNRGETYFVTRFSSENHWVIDCYFSADSMMPVWSNGEATRVTIGHVLNDEIAAQLNAEVEAHVI